MIAATHRGDLIRRARLSEPRSIHARARYGAVIAAMHRVGAADLLTRPGRVPVNAIATVLHQLDDRHRDAESEEARALRETLSLGPNSIDLHTFVQFIRRSRPWIREVVGSLNEDGHGL